MNEGRKRKKIESNDVVKVKLFSKKITIFLLIFFYSAQIVKRFARIKKHYMIIKEGLVWRKEKRRCKKEKENFENK